MECPCAPIENLARTNSGKARLLTSRSKVRLFCSSDPSMLFRVFRVFRCCFTRWNEGEWRLAAGRFLEKFGENAIKSWPNRKSSISVRFGFAFGLDLNHPLFRWFSTCVVTPELLLSS